MNKIMYKSTRGRGRLITASAAILKGIAEDGGLFVPTEIPRPEISLEKMINMDYKSLAYHIMKDYFQDFEEAEIRECIDKAYDEKFDTPEIAPVVKKSGVYFLELFHGPTLAFKDMALSILPYFLKTAAKKQKLDSEIVILTATSGDTGKAALEGFAGVPGTKIIVFFPESGVSEVQKLQMVTQTGENTYVIGIRGNFDDAQTGVKEMFSDKELQMDMSAANFVFSSANSINIGRLVPQIVYYFYAYLQLCRMGDIKAGEEINFTVPTGNFGNILAGYHAKKMGLPVRHLICASNENKVLYDFLNTGVYDKKRNFITTMSPSMDILVSSNLERLLFYLYGEDSSMVGELMAQLSGKGAYMINDNVKDKLNDFYGYYASEADTAEAIRKMYEDCGYVIDTHTAVALSAYGKHRKRKCDENIKTVIVSTASPYKFTSDVMKSIDPKYSGQNSFQLIKEMSRLTGAEIPKGIRDLDSRPVIHNTVCNKDEMKKQAEKILGL
ncbi:MAG TPA: threonine synthase [Bacillota bacterium]|nr:threonine synthase [Bacillota bacterium]HQA66630.1 threonine synthase [Bacillota bacterium]HQO43587.1 threonine synthase [Bacillota bacterium]HQQ44817.1 threonine synthase [Bacillota bacterium]